jgi:hypothetical protein
MPGTKLECVVVGVADGGLECVAAEARAKRPARTVERPARCSANTLFSPLGPQVADPGAT